MGIAGQIQEFLRNLFQWWVTIAPWQQGVRVRCGKRTKLLGPGIHLKLPIVDTVYMQPIRVRAAYIAAQTLTTADGKAIAVAASLRYEITDLLLLYRTLHNAHDTIEQQAQGVLSAYVFTRRLDELRPDVVETHVAAALDLSAYGLKVHSFSITSFAVVKTYRLINGELGAYTGYDQRLDTTRPLNLSVPA